VLGWDVREVREGGSRAGAVYVDVTRHRAWAPIDLGVSAGLAAYPTLDAGDVGGQVAFSASFHVVALVVRARYTTRTGPGVFLAYQLTFPGAIVESR
jgi:hypothetical protein